MGRRVRCVGTEHMLSKDNRSLSFALQPSWLVVGVHGFMLEETTQGCNLLSSCKTTDEVDQSAPVPAAAKPSPMLFLRKDTISITRETPGIELAKVYANRLEIPIGTSIRYPLPPMDPFTAEGELVNIHTSFIQGQYQSVLSDFDPSSFSSSNNLPVQILQSRAQCALGQYDEVIGSISDSDAKSTPDLAAARTFASYLQSGSDNALAEAERLAESQGDNLTVQLLCGTILARAGKPEEALHLLSQHQGSLDAVALQIQIHLSQNRTDLALKEAKSARSFAQDALLVNLAESWIAMRQGGENYQKAFYVFEELAQAPSSASVTTLVSQAVSELHMGRLEEAEVALNEALRLEPGNGVALANKVVLDTILGRDPTEGIGKLEGLEGGSEMVGDFRAKREAFGVAMGKYTPKFEP